MTEIGSTLREARMHARIDISEVEAHTKIRAKYLRAIENEEWDLLPGSVYIKSFLRTYGDYLGLDSRLLIDEFKRRYERPDHGPVSTRSPRDRERPVRDKRAGPSRGRSFVFSPKILVVAVLVVVVLALYLIGSGGGNSNNPPAGGVTTPRTHTHKHRQPPTTTTHHAATKTHKTPPPPKNATLALVPTGDVWVCVENGRGKPLIAGISYTPGQTIPTETAHELLVTLGNASVTMKANGKPYTVPSSTVAIGLRITPTGVHRLTPGPTCVS